MIFYAMLARTIEVGLRYIFKYYDSAAEDQIFFSNIVRSLVFNNLT